MADRPILFSGSMVRALLDGRKTQTRRLLTANNLRIWTGGLDFGGQHVRPDASMFAAAMNNPRGFRFIENTLAWVTDPAPHQVGAVMAQWQGRLSIATGDRLWVRETVIGEELSDGLDGVRYVADNAFIQIGNTPNAAAKWVDLHAYGWPGGCPELRGKTVPSIHMPRWASRLTLIATDVRVERLHYISEEDALAEGVPTDNDYAGSFEKEYCRKCGGSSVHGSFGEGYGVIEVDCSECETPALRYRNLWDHINGPGAWEANPWVVAYTFRVIKANIDHIGETQ